MIESLKKAFEEGNEADNQVDIREFFGKMGPKIKGGEIFA